MKKSITFKIKTCFINFIGFESTINPFDGIFFHFTNDSLT